MTTELSLCERIQETIPNAEPHWSGCANYDACDVAWQDGYIIVTPDDLEPGYLVGIYTTEGWTELGETCGSIIVASADDAVALVDYLTENQPEGTDWAAWAAQRCADMDRSDYVTDPSTESTT
jgi:hypothetical protein